MMLSLLSSLLLLGWAAAERKIIFGRSVHKRPSPLKRIRSSQREELPLTKEVTTVEAPRILIEDGSRGLDESSMSFSLDFSMFSVPIIEPTTDATPTQSPVAPPVEPDADLAKLFAQALFEDVIQCSGLDLVTDTCMVSTFTALWAGGMGSGRQRRLHASNGMIRFLQTPDETEDDCGAVPQIPEQALRAVLIKAKDQCEESGSDITDEEFDKVFENFMQLFANEQCWAPLCDEGYVAALTYKVYFDYGATCAGVELKIPDCVYDKMIDLLVVYANTEVSSYTPTKDELLYIVSTLLVEPAKDQCIAMGVDMGSTDWKKVSSDIVDILSALTSPTCTPESEANPEPRSSFLTAEANSTGASSSGAYTMTFVVAAAGCAVAIAVLVAGLYRLNKRTERTPLEKLNDSSIAEIYTFM